MHNVSDDFLPPVLLLPGFLCDQTVWDPVLSYLHELADFHVLTLSLMNNTSAMADAIIQNAPPQFAVAGHSLGGWVAMEIARKVPHRVTKLCLISTTGEADTPAQKQMRLKRLERVKEGRVASVIEEIVQLFTQQEKIKTTLREMLLRNLASFVPQQESVLARRTILSDLSGVPVPTLVIQARCDRVFPEPHSQKIVNALPNAKLAVVENSGHMVTMEMPEAVTALMRYWMMYF